MVYKRNRLILVLVGFLLLAIPLYLFYYSLNNLYLFTVEKSRENLKQKLFASIKKIENSLDPFEFLKAECTKIHEELLPEYPQEVIDGYPPDDSYINKVYSEELLNKLVNLTENRFAPILITLGSNNLKKIHAYFSPELKKQFLNDKEGIRLLRDKTIHDLDLIEGFYSRFFDNRVRVVLLDEDLRKTFVPGMINYCYKYLSAFKSFRNNLTATYTDYFGKQTIYPILKYTFSQKGIHGYYTLVIAQSHIDPNSMIDSITSESDSEFNIKLIDNESSNQIDETEEGFICKLKFPTVFINHVKAFRRLRGKNENENKNENKKDLLTQQLQLSLYYHKDILFMKRSIDYIKIASFISLLFYLSFSIWYLKKNQVGIKILLTKKLICILSVIVLLPIIGICIYTVLYAHNFEEYLDKNIEKTLHNSLEELHIRDQENNLRHYSSILELKRRISKHGINSEKSLIQNNILNNKEAITWLNDWYDEIFGISNNLDFYAYRDRGFIKGRDNERDRQNKKYYKSFFYKYMNNLGLVKNTSHNLKEGLTRTVSLGILEQYITLEQEEKTVTQESIPCKDILSFKTIDKGTFCCVKDVYNKYYFYYSKKASLYSNPYNYINYYTEKINPFWFNPKNKFTDLYLSILYNTDTEKRKKLWPVSKVSPKEITEIINNSLDSKNSNLDSGVEKIKNENGSIVKEWLVTDNEPLILMGVAKSNNKQLIKSIIALSIVILVIYAIILLFLLTEFISSFIKEPVNIYIEAISELENNHYGIIINSFSKDEFDNITKAFNEMSVAIKQREQIKRYVSDKLVESVSENKVQEAGEGKQERVTILSSDIRNFTGISEMYEPSAIVEMLNGYFTKMQQAISKNGGIIDKYIGDAIQAVFYDEPNKENQVLRAAKAALEMRKALEVYNKEREEAGLFTIQNGIGIDTDIAITGTIGTEKGRKDFSVNGDVIARAAELEAKTKKTESKILISKRSVEELDCHVANASRNDEYNSKMVRDNKTTHAPHQSPQLIFKVFDEESVELIDV